MLVPRHHSFGKHSHTEESEQKFPFFQKSQSPKTQYTKIEEKEENISHRKEIKEYHPTPIEFRSEVYYDHMKALLW